MRSDPRLQIQSPAQSRYEAKRCAVKQEYLAQLDSESWKVVVSWLSEAILHLIDETRVVRETPTIPHGNTNILNAIEHLSLWIASGGTEEIAFDARSESFGAVAEAVGSLLAQRTPPDWQAVYPLHRLLSDCWPIHETWLANLPNDVILATKTSLMGLGVDGRVADHISSWGILREGKYKQAFLGRAEERELSKLDPWEYANSSLDRGGEIELSADLRFAGRLTARLDSQLFLTWVGSLPVLEMRACAMGLIQDLDFLEELVRVLTCSNSIRAVKDQDRLLALTIWHFLEISSRIESNLAHWSSDRWGSSTEDGLLRQETKHEQLEWQDTELPARCKRFVETMLLNSHGAGMRLVESMLRRIYCVDYRRQRVWSVFRNVLAHEVALRKDDRYAIVSRILEHSRDDADKSSLLNLLLIISDVQERDNGFKDILSELWSRFVRLVVSQPFYWNADFESGDDGLLAWNVAWMLAHLDDPQELILRVFQEVEAPTEGWCYNAKHRYESERAVAYCGIVGSMSAEWLVMADRREEAQTVLGTVASLVRTWLREDHRRSEEAKTLIIHTFARMPLVFSDNYGAMAHENIGAMDNLEHVMVAARALELNLTHGAENDSSETKVDDGGVKLESGLRNLIEERFQAQFPLVRLEHRFTPQMEKWYLDILESLKA